MKTKIIIALLAILTAFFLIAWLPQAIDESGVLDSFLRETYRCLRMVTRLP